MELDFYPEKTEEVTKTFEKGNVEESSFFKLTEIMTKSKDDIEKNGLPECEVTLKVYIGASSGGKLPIVKNEFEATIKLTSP